MNNDYVDFAIRGSTKACNKIKEFFNKIGCFNYSDPHYMDKDSLYFTLGDGEVRAGQIKEVVIKDNEKTISISKGFIEFVKVNAKYVIENPNNLILPNYSMGQQVKVKGLGDLLLGEVEKVIVCVENNENIHYNYILRLENGNVIDIKWKEEDIEPI